MIDYESNLADEIADTLIALEAASDPFTARHLGERPTRQPVHVVYGGAHLFSRNSAAKLGELALRSLDTYGPDPFTFARALGLPGSSELARDESGAKSRYITDPEALRRDDPTTWLAITVYDRVRGKLEAEPVEDFRLDFEEGYGHRPDNEEDATAVTAAQELAAGLDAGTLPPFCGIRIKPLSGELHRRAVRTLDGFVTANWSDGPFCSLRMRQLRSPRRLQASASG